MQVRIVRCSQPCHVHTLLEFRKFGQTSNLPILHVKGTGTRDLIAAQIEICQIYMNYERIYAKLQQAGG